MNPESTEQTSAPATGEAAQSGNGSFEIKPEDRSWFENLLDQAKDRPLTPEEKQKLADKFKNYDVGIKRYKGDLETQRASLAERENEVRRVLDEIKQSKSQKETSAILRGTDQETRDLIEDAIEKSDDPTGRETLRFLDRALKQRESRSSAKVEKLEKEVTELRQLLQGVQQTTQVSRSSALNSELKDLEKKYGEPMVEKYRDAIIQYGTQYPSYSARKLLHMIANEDELEQAIELKARFKQTNGSSQTHKPEIPRPTSTSQADPAEKYRGASVKERSKGLKQAIHDAVLDGMGKIPGVGKMS